MKNILLISADRSTSAGTANNLGDAFLTDALAMSLMDSGFEVQVADFGGARLVGSLPRSPILGTLSLVKALWSTDSVVIGGGTLLQDDAPQKLVGGLPRLLFVSAVTARLLGRKVAFFGVGCDSVERFMPRFLLGVALRMGRVWVRDEASQGRCHSQFGKRVELAGDTSLLYHPDLGGGESRSLARASPDRGGRGAVVALNRSHSSALTLPIVEGLLAQYERVDFLSMYQGHPVSDASDLPADAASALSSVSTDLSWEQAVSAISGASVVIASRMHAMYIAAMVEVPLLAISGSAKIDAFIDEFKVSSVDSLTGAGNPGVVPDAAAVRSAGLRVSLGMRELSDYLRS
ncbi:hypothetical protein E3O42_16865 [Cryobacterium adonitolivorans]|uniref:Polysaccharide pyruvyl transferase domain-containing protein n=1 Tax=Cryobacterium adonitolivorans TaxID=1259189 RepID=A0A4V3IC13_9MICO|nr:polysaccharide pyruvyl transferase family protein [Cryobacterium adonitolivorans]TFB96809.1 hypothetical protein E3O42_16865 [Cryobacterium adonitolivorans]